MQASSPSLSLLLDHPRPVIRKSRLVVERIVAVWQVAIRDSCFSNETPRGWQRDKALSVALSLIRRESSV